MLPGKSRYYVVLASTLLLSYCEKQNPVVDDLPRLLDTLKVSPRSAPVEVGQTLIITVRGGTKPYSYSSPKASLYQIISSSDSSIIVSPLDSGRIVINVADNSTPIQRDSVVISAFRALPAPISEDLFPLVVGRRIVYSGFLRHETADTNITSTGGVYQASWTVMANAAGTPFGSAHIVNDSTRIPREGPTPPIITLVSSLYFQRASPTGSGNFSMIHNIGRFYRTFGIQASDSLRWMLLAKQDAGIGVQWTAFDSTWAVNISGASTTARLRIIGVFEGRETLILAGQTFDAYKLSLTRYIYLGGSATPASVASIATIWFAPDLGPVKMILNADGENYGHYREFYSRNF